MTGTMPIELQAARLKLARERAYLTAALWALNPVEVEGLGTLGVDEWWRLYYDPKVVEKWSPEELVGVLYHEVGHILRQHAGRCKAGSFHHKLFNIAGDAEINDDLASEHGVKLPEGCVYPSTLGAKDGLLAEEYYQHVVDNSKNVKIVQCKTCKGTGRVAAPQPKQGQSDGDKQEGAQDQGSGQDDKQSTDKGKGKGKGHGSQGTVPCPDCGGHGVTGEHGERVIPIPGGGNCGSIADGLPRWWEDGTPNGANESGVRDAEGELIRRQVAKDIQEHSKTRGDVPGWLQRWANEKLSPKVNWRKQLQAAIRQVYNDITGKVDYSYRRPSRRMSVLPDVVMPSMRQPVPSVIVQIDTSGSMSDTMLAQALAETAGVLKGLGLREGVTVLSIDAAIGFAKKVFRADQVKLTGGGGTDMGVGIHYVMKMKHKPDMLIILTDCYTPWPQEPPPFKVVIGRLSDGQVPPWAKIIDIKPG